MKQVNVVIKKLSHGIYDGEMNDTIDMFWSQYQAFNNKNGRYDGDDFTWIIKDIIQGSSNIFHHNYSLPCTKVIGFVTCRLTLKILGIGAAECSWGDVKKIKYDEISATRSDVSEKHSIVYISDCNELGRIA